MPKRLRKPKRPADVNALAKSILDDVIALAEQQPKDPAAVALGRKGGKVGGKRRAQNMTPEERSEAAKRAAAARWKPKG